MRTLELITVTNDAYINALSVCELLTKIAARSWDVPVTLVLDNAKYQRCKAVTECANKLGIELLFLPPYSPNLNLIERLWKFIKKKCLYSRYYENFHTFKTAITSCIDKLDEEFKTELEKLMVPNFQTFKDVKVAAR